MHHVQAMHGRDLLLCIHDTSTNFPYLSLQSESFRGLSTHARNRQAPPQAIRPISIAGAVDQAELRLEAVPSRRHGDGYGEVAGSRMEVR